MHHYTVRNYKGRSCLFEGEKPRTLPMYMPGDTFGNVGKTDVDLFLAAGVTDFYLWIGRDEEVREMYTNPFWPGVDRLGEPKFVSPERFISLPERIAYIIERCPDARFMLRYYAHAPKEWKAKFPEEMSLDESGHRQCDTSLASERYERDHKVALKHMIRWVESQSWAWRVMGYVSLHEGEGTSKLASPGFLFDHSEPTQKAFREFRPKGEGVPSQKRFDEARRDGGYASWPPPESTEAERDYFELIRRLFLRRCRIFVETVLEEVGERRVLIGMDALKQPMQGWLNVPFFSGTAPRAHFSHKLLTSGSTGIDEALAIPGFNLLNTPYDYTFRQMGGSPEPEGALDSAVLRGKLFLVEDDARTFAASEDESYGYFRNMAEVRAGLWRNAAAAISRGYQAYWMDVTSRPTPQGGYFRDPQIMEVVRSIAPIFRQSLEWEHEDVPAVAVIVDDRSALHGDFSSDFHNLAVFWQRLTELSQAGLPYRIYLWEDLLNDRLPDHRLFIFPDLFLMNEERLAVLRERVCRRGRTVLWGPATGITDGKKLGAEGTMQATGIPMRFSPHCCSRRVVLSRFDHAVTSGLRGPISYGDSTAYGPLLLPEWDNGGSVQGIALTAKGQNFPGLVIKEIGTGEDRWTSVFSVAAPVPGCLIRELARYAGAHIYSEENDVIFASRNFLAVHATRGGSRTIRLPRSCVVRDVVSDAEIGRGLDHLSLEFHPPETRIFRLSAD